MRWVFLQTLFLSPIRSIRGCSCWSQIVGDTNIKEWFCFYWSLCKHIRPCSWLTSFFSLVSSTIIRKDGCWVVPLERVVPAGWWTFCSAQITTELPAAQFNQFHMLPIEFSHDFGTSTLRKKRQFFFNIYFVHLFVVFIPLKYGSPQPPLDGQIRVAKQTIKIRWLAATTKATKGSRTSGKDNVMLFKLPNHPADFLFFRRPQAITADRGSGIRRTSNFKNRTS